MQSLGAINENGTKENKVDISVSWNLPEAYVSDIQNALKTHVHSLHVHLHFLY